MSTWIEICLCVTGMYLTGWLTASIQIQLQWPICIVGTQHIACLLFVDQSAARLCCLVCLISSANTDRSRTKSESVSLKGKKHHIRMEREKKKLFERWVTHTVIKYLQGYKLSQLMKLRPYVATVWKNNVCVDFFYLFLPHGEESSISTCPAVSKYTNSWTQNTGLT